jgi:hypothetical protein
MNTQQQLDMVRQGMLMQQFRHARGGPNLLANLKSRDYFAGETFVVPQGMDNSDARANQLVNEYSQRRRAEHQQWAAPPVPLAPQWNTGVTLMAPDMLKAAGFVTNPWAWSRPVTQELYILPGLQRARPNPADPGRYN